MIKKTPIRRIAKRVGISVELQKAAVIDEYNEVGIRTGDMLMAETAEEAQEIEASVKPAAIEEPKQPEPEKAKEPEPPPPPPPQEKKPEPAVEGEEMMTVAQKKSIQSLFKKFGIEAGEAQCKVLGVDILKIGKPVESIDGLTKKQAGKAIEVLQDIFGPSNNEPNQA
jgi:type IV secretory pathway VirB10-like protein